MSYDKEDLPIFERSEERGFITLMPVAKVIINSVA
ncbi:hypothetical protein M948_04605 [Virgibacillus sp. CM-4]|nr:hypothetical protein M948_04605 [Virgibacillus sp. CM-4]